MDVKWMSGLALWGTKNRAHKLVCQFFRVKMLSNLPDPDCALKSHHQCNFKFRGQARLQELWYNIMDELAWKY